MLDKMPGDALAEGREPACAYAFMYAHPGKKLLFMGDEFGQWREWDNEGSLDWDLLDALPHRALLAFVRDLNRLYAGRARALRARLRSAGLPVDRRQRSREQRRRVPARGAAPETLVAVISTGRRCLREGYRIGVPRGRHVAGAAQHRRRRLRRLGRGPDGAIETEPIRAHGFDAVPHALAAAPRRAAGPQAPVRDSVGRAS